MKWPFGGNISVYPLSSVVYPKTEVGRVIVTVTPRRIRLSGHMA
jgi:hypothetical protein